MTKLLLHVWQTWFGEPLRRVEAESLAYRLSDEGRRVDWKTPTVLLTAAICLTLQQYTATPGQVLGTARFLASTFGGPDSAAEVDTLLRKWSGDQLAARLWWAGIAVLTYAIIPLLVLTIGFRARPADYGLKLRGVLNAWPLYVLFTLVMVPLVWVCSGEDRFQQTYPFFRFGSPEHVRKDLWKWELAYAAQFVSLEFFFRGFIIHGTKHRFGMYAVFVSVVPYVLIHFGKPMPEATASIIAGVVLGFMSLVTRSVWLGAALHIGVAWGMDFACLARRGFL
ncbi:caax amino terminal protease : Abortive infection protein OS=Nitrosomonas sp. (strain Is79A3) GN=Nit79A3_3094 PE=4 SV=1: Abi [Gemmata massiliana]|uniref:CAAX prenyl protease 2/Lysostaphin resistance protein A-like domain-containing protein n=1 Tax=Gemmata massiliana TaxID=1210884 RepID=A0A6P2CUH8_9BACT|nr:CPBP family intramembrane glutamic endopeptidase [Gemmata massiliana]VTR92629.1 caax amino terminal protease : Abortive infection protein OS=Nitrosomonas sp. (strain Is79A3) GN=Nit79A3_3094 PE=4 SV=1: Abi [Gemmata massiliana]